MPAFPYYSLDGVPLDDPAGRWFIDGGTFELPPLAAARTVDVTVPGRHGILPVAGLELEPVTVGASLVITDTTPAGASGGVSQLHANYEAVKALVGRRHRHAVLGYHMDADTVRVADAILTSGATPEVVSQRVLRLPVLWQIPTVFWRDPAPAVWGRLLHLLATPTHVDTLAGATAPIIDALLRITGPATDPWLSDAATGGRIAYDGTLTAGQSLLIDCGRMRAALVTDDAWNVDDGQDVTGRVEATGPGSGSRWLHLTPEPIPGDPTARRVTVTAGAASASGALVEIKARRAYL